MNHLEVVLEVEVRVTGIETILVDVTSVEAIVLVKAASIDGAVSEVSVNSAANNLLDVASVFWLPKPAGGWVAACIKLLLLSFSLESVLLALLRPLTCGLRFPCTGSIVSVAGTVGSTS